MDILSAINILLSLLLAPLFLGVVNRTKAEFAGRRGKPLLQAYRDIAKLMGKGAVYSRTTTWVFRAGPVVGLASALGALTLLPFGYAPALVAFPGDIVLFAYLIGLMRFFTVVAALDTGSSFEGMGASREAIFSAIAEPVLFLCLAALARHAGSLSLSGIFSPDAAAGWSGAGPAAVMVGAALFIVSLAENSRIPVDDPNTHLELTMIHEVMVLDHSGPDLAFIEYASALKIWAFGTLTVCAAVPFGALDAASAEGLFFISMFALAAAVGIVESVMARLRLLRVPQFLAGAAALAAFALILVI